MENNPSQTKRSRRKFTQGCDFDMYTRPKMIAAAQEALLNENISEEGFLGAQAVLIMNGIL